ncbi:MAG: 2-hydroxyglutaryl-CoA dehydratase [Syntrophorhabdus aromaticivorans]|uniref:2-hydroxyglutaryl-CoA dehydratase n=1 Tax=Syntrophorhabdus aromaticivorans TaxID=328301 RepID=A0A971M539_9BACT|nr:2-hydroxyglutaryl-CoA dehydratase [Syntrophorhabdus aromaticivorans]
MTYALGLDIGSGYSKAVICEDRTLRSFAVLPSGGDYKEVARHVTDMALRKASLSFNDIAQTVTTGYGSSMVGFADHSATDIACHAAGVHCLFPSARTVIDIGAQFSKTICVDEAGRATYFLLNEKCAGGSGKFLQIIARILHITIDDIGPLSLTATKPVEFTTACAVFAESEAVSRIAEGALPADILAGIHKAMASKIVNLVTRIGPGADCVVTGGGAKDIGLVRAIEAELALPVTVADEPRITAALGAAIMAAEQIAAEKKRDQFSAPAARQFKCSSPV